jgi:hypothetical protein
MARLYSLTGKWELEEWDSGDFLGKFCDPVTFVTEGTWFDVIKEVEKSVSKIMLDRIHYRPKGVGLPIFLFRDGGFAERLSRELMTRTNHQRSLLIVRDALERLV